MTGTAVASIDTIVAIIRQLDGVGEVIRATVEEQGSAAMEITHNAAEAAKGAQEVAQAVIGVSGAVTETDQLSQTVRRNADELARTLDTSVGEFLTSARQAV